MSDSDTILEFGGWKLDELYNRTQSRDDVFDYLKGVINKYDTIDPAISEATKKELEVIKTQIDLLSLPAGFEYLRTDLDSRPQHIRRAEEPVWTNTKTAAARKKAGLSKFKLLAEEPDHCWAVYTDDKLRYWNQYDLLGLFFSKMGPAPGHGGANQTNFYLPLTAVYAKFCLWIGGNQIPSMIDDGPKKKRKGAGIGDPPSCFQCTWRSESGHFFLGASLGGFRFIELDYGTWENVVRGARWHLFDKRFWKFPGEWGPFELGNSPTKKWEAKKTLFGNCGETYPFLEMIGEHIKDLVVRRQTRGLALGSTFAKVAEYSTEEFSPMLTPPCMNCQQLLRFAQGPSVNQFCEGVTMKIPLFPDPDVDQQPGGES